MIAWLLGKLANNPATLGYVAVAAATAGFVAGGAVAGAATYKWQQARIERAEGRLKLLQDQVRFANETAQYIQAQADSDARNAQAKIDNIASELRHALSRPARTVDRVRVVRVRGVCKPATVTTPDPVPESRDQPPPVAAPNPFARAGDYRCFRRDDYAGWRSGITAERDRLRAGYEALWETVAAMPYVQIKD